MALQFANPGVGAPSRSQSIPRVAQVAMPLPLALPTAPPVPFTSSSPSVLVNLPRGASPSRPMTVRRASPNPGAASARQPHAPTPQTPHAPVPSGTPTSPMPTPLGSAALTQNPACNPALWARAVSPLAAAGSSLAARTSLQQVGALDTLGRSRSGSPVRGFNSSWMTLRGADSPRQRTAFVRPPNGASTPHYQVNGPCRHVGAYTPRMPAAAAAAAGAATAAAAAVAAAANGTPSVAMSTKSNVNAPGVAIHAGGNSGSLANGTASVASAATSANMARFHGEFAQAQVDGRTRRVCSSSPDKPRRNTTAASRLQSCAPRYGNRSVPFPDHVAVVQLHTSLAANGAVASQSEPAWSLQPPHTERHDRPAAHPVVVSPPRQVRPSSLTRRASSPGAQETASQSSPTNTSAQNTLGPDDMMVTRSEAWERLQPGVEVTVGNHRLRCINILGSGSYSVVWRAQVLSSSEECPAAGDDARRVVEQDEVALKDVVCKSQTSLRQSLFEVQLLLGFERRMLLRNSGSTLQTGPLPTLRLPRCFSYKVVDHAEGGWWCVRMAMSRLPGEQLDDWLRRAATEVISTAATPAPGCRPEAWTSFLKRGGTMAERLVKQIGPALEGLAPMAWHRDVNSHNILVSDCHEQDLLDPADTGERSEFWLCDLGLAVDSETWASDEGAWRVTDIGGDCRYWPASSWMVHLYGADYLAERPEFCRQYQTRLDVHGLGITAVELLCSTALAARSAGIPGDGGPSDARWARLLDAWQRYHETVSGWWETIYSVFSTGGDFRPVHSWLVKEAVADQVIFLLEEIRTSLRDCATFCCGDDLALQRLIRVVAELTDEASVLELKDVCALLEQGIGTSETPAKAEPPVAAPVSKVPATRVRSAVAPAVAPAPAPNTARAATKTPDEATPTSKANASSGATTVLLPDYPAPAPAVASCGGPTEGEIMAMATAAAQEGRRFLETLSPIPPIAAGMKPLDSAADPATKERGRQASRQSRQVEVAELKEAKVQLKRDLELLQKAKMRLQQLRTNAAAGAAAVAVAAAVTHCPNRQVPLVAAS